MNKFFTIADGEDKVVQKEQRIYADTMKVFNGENFTLKTTSNAIKQKIKFFIDLVELEIELEPVGGAEPEIEIQFFRVGQYVELEHNENAQIFNTNGFTNYRYRCSDNNNGTFTFSFDFADRKGKPDTAIFYISSVIFEDSFYNPTNNWLNPDNPENMLEELEDDIDPNLPFGAEKDDLLAYKNDLEKAEWRSPKEVADTFPIASKTQVGVVKIDEKTILISNGVISSLSEGGNNYLLTEQDTGLLWHDGKKVYEKTYIDVVTNTVIEKDIDCMISMVGACLQTDGTRYRSFGINASPSSHAYLDLMANGEIIPRLVGYTNTNYLVIRYTKRSV